MNTKAPTTAGLRIVRLAMILSVVTAAGIFWLLQRARAMTNMGEPASTYLGYAFLATLVIGLGMIVLFRSAARKNPTGKAHQLTIMAWGMGEGLALFGAVIYLLSGNPTQLALGVLAFVAALLIHPIAETD